MEIINITSLVDNIGLSHWDLSIATGQSVPAIKSWLQGGKIPDEKECLAIGVIRRAMFNAQHPLTVCYFDSADPRKYRRVLKACFGNMKNAIKWLSNRKDIGEFSICAAQDNGYNLIEIFYSSSPRLRIDLDDAIKK